MPNHHAGTLTGIVDFGVDRSCSRMQYPWRESYGLPFEVTFLFGLYTNFDCHSNLMRVALSWLTSRRSHGQFEFSQVDPQREGQSSCSRRTARQQCANSRDGLRRVGITASCCSILYLATARPLSCKAQQKDLRAWTDGRSYLARSMQRFFRSSNAAILCETIFLMMEPPATASSPARNRKQRPV